LAQDVPFAQPVADRDTTEVGGVLARRWWVEELNVDTMEQDLKPILRDVWQEERKLRRRYQDNLINPLQQIPVHGLVQDLRWLMKRNYGPDLRKVRKPEKPRQKKARTLTFEKVNYVGLACDT
jgi:hypothetical protein